MGASGNEPDEWIVNTVPRSPLCPPKYQSQIKQQHGPMDTYPIGKDDGPKAWSLMQLPANVGFVRFR
jgi:hypothetical protein